MTDESESDALIVEQISYYGARTPEHDQWFRSVGRYDRGEETNQRWFAAMYEVRAAISEVEGDDVGWGGRRTCERRTAWSTTAACIEVPERSEQADRARYPE